MMIHVSIMIHLKFEFCKVHTNLLGYLGTTWGTPQMGHVAPIMTSWGMA